VTVVVDVDSADASASLYSTGFQMNVFRNWRLQLLNWSGARLASVLPPDCPALAGVPTVRSHGAIDPADRVEVHALVRFGASVLPGSWHDSAGRVLVEDKDLGAGVAKPLQGEEAEQGGLGRAGGAEDEGVADVADEVEAKGGRAGRAAGDVGGADAADRFEVGAYGVAGPDGAQRHEVGEVEGVDDGAADVGVDVAGQASQPGLGGVEGLVLTVKPRDWRTSWMRWALRRTSSGLGSQTVTVVVR